MKRTTCHLLLAGTWAAITSAATVRLPLNVPGLSDIQRPIVREDDIKSSSRVGGALQDVLDALSVMQETYFDNFAGTWLDAIDWTAAVTGTHLSASMTAIIDGLDLSFAESCSDLLQWENVINQYFAQTSFFYFGEDAFSIRNEANDDMLWVALEWLEVIKFADMYAKRHEAGRGLEDGRWHGLQITPLAAHRARIFYELASAGWDDSLCDGGMTWNPSLEPYKNAITNELYTAASISMYLYFPGDNNSAPFLETQDQRFCHAHDPIYLENAIKSYKWLKESNMRNHAGLYQDGFHITGWQRYRNGTINPGTGQCDDLDRMVYTYNQGVILTANRGLWLATGARSYLEDGHDLVSRVIRATGWPNTDTEWQGLGRGGVLEEYCDHGLHCSQDGQTFKGIFFLHFTEFCRPLRSFERDILADASVNGFDEQTYLYHLARCQAYAKWIEHNAAAALATKNEDGLFGMWWGVPYNTHDTSRWERISKQQELPDGVIDHRNPVSSFRPFESDGDLNDRGRGRTVETQGGALAILRARWLWRTLYR